MVTDSKAPYTTNHTVHAST